MRGLLGCLIRISFRRWGCPLGGLGLRPGVRRGRGKGKGKGKENTVWATANRLSVRFGSVGAA
jgi:hypothetical protein